MSLIFYNIIYYLKRKQKSFQQSLTSYTYVHPKYIEPLLSNLNQLSNKQNLRESFDLFRNNEIFVFGKIFGPIRFDYDYFNNEFGNINNFKKIKHMVFSREGLPCFRCSKKIVKLITASRRIYICPICQDLNQ